mmetsp:Transcript_25643/g.37743  ORF Transcript_25643/g.37743 Transcript_25643/m.37743 type:complete len:717 (-) Transcript_25643:203-2353(-)|eukprot:CAMPEP_0195516418 /NCGR_PEP_ID=MMETSP0794_2-20130614/7145_1 /TAXON_ID=515487 /ORGANISM="Stephanopyxis turris, Strain CCMP 815" /LENGTH=716 /DNA_ID=CAMNT_0040645003 /DNA_START=430 /DNA_END=2580 /DNA_ORIENTATION=+
MRVILQKRKTPPPPPLSSSSLVANNNNINNNNSRNNNNSGGNGNNSNSVSIGVTSSSCSTSTSVSALNASGVKGASHNTTTTESETVGDNRGTLFHTSTCSSQSKRNSIEKKRRKVCRTDSTTSTVRLDSFSSSCSSSSSSSTLSNRKKSDSTTVTSGSVKRDKSRGGGLKNQYRGGVEKVVATKKANSSKYSSSSNCFVSSSSASASTSTAVSSCLLDSKHGKKPSSSSSWKKGKQAVTMGITDKSISSNNAIQKRSTTSRRNINSNANENSINYENEAPPLNDENDVDPAEEENTSDIMWVQRNNDGDDYDNAHRNHDFNNSNNIDLSSDRTANKPITVEEEIAAFCELLKTTRGLELVEQEGDGNCLFRAVSLQVYGDAGMHGEVRRRCLEYMSKEEEHFSLFITDEPFADYVSRKRIDGVHGNNPEIQAISELYNRPVEVYVPSKGPKPLNIFHTEYKTDDVPIRLSYHDGNHYNALIDPLCPTAGLGLGLPGLQPGLADKMQLKTAFEESDKLAFRRQIEKAVEDSDQIEIQRAIRESKKSLKDQEMYNDKALALSDLEATDFALEQAVLNSSLENYQNKERKQPRATTTREMRRSQSPETYGASTTTSHSCSSSPHAFSSSHSHAMAATTSSTASSAQAASYLSGGTHVQPHPINAHDIGTTAQRERDEYPQTVQELVMNGFELSRVLRAYDLVGDNFDDLLAFLMTANT